MSTRERRLFVILFFLFILSLVVFESLGPIEFKKSSDREVGSLLVSLFVIAAFLERALEVYISTTRGPGAMVLENNILIARHELDKFDSAQARKDLLDCEHARELYRLDTKKIALWVGLMAGVLISAVGIRTLGVLVDYPDGPQNFQRQILNIIDVLLTGGLLAGGSNGLHQFAELYTSYLSMLNQNVTKNQPNNQMPYHTGTENNKPKPPEV